MSDQMLKNLTRYLDHVDFAGLHLVEDFESINDY